MQWNAWDGLGNGIYWRRAKKKLLTSDENQGRPDHVLPEQFMVAGGEPLEQVIVPRDVDRHVTGQAVRNVDGERQQTLHALSHSERRIMNHPECLQGITETSNATYISSGKFSVIDPFTFEP